MTPDVVLCVPSCEGAVAKAFELAGVTPVVTSARALNAGETINRILGMFEPERPLEGRFDRLAAPDGQDLRQVADRAGAESDRTGAAKRITECEQALTDARTAYAARRDELGLTDEQYCIAKTDIANIATMLEQLSRFVRV